MRRSLVGACGSRVVIQTLHTTHAHNPCWMIRCGAALWAARVELLVKGPGLLAPGASVSYPPHHPLHAPWCSLQITKLPWFKQQIHAWLRSNDMPIPPVSDHDNMDKLRGQAVGEPVFSPASHRGSRGCSSARARASPSHNPAEHSSRGCKPCLPPSAEAWAGGGLCEVTAARGHRHGPAAASRGAGTGAPLRHSQPTTAPDVLPSGAAGTFSRSHVTLHLLSLRPQRSTPTCRSGSQTSGQTPAPSACAPRRSASPICSLTISSCSVA